ncbi:MAG TPA: helix-turn-helix transcriptional regulator [Solirubrobacterales bacterium]|nr:helix-turn-helix transcriptional regulator [Solirubrobacterales bacterium]
MDPEPKVVIGRNIRRHRQRRGWTQEDLSRITGIHPAEVGRAERGERDLRASTIVKFANGLEVPSADLMVDL